MPFRVAAAETATAVILVLELDDDFRAGGLRLGIKRIGAVDDHVEALGRSTADLVRLPQQPSIFGIDHRCHHHHAVAEGQLRVGDAHLLIAILALAFEAEGLAQPIDGGGDIAIAQAGDQRRAGVLALI